MKHVLACLAIVMLTGCVEANEVAHQYADGIRADIQAPGQIARGLRARAALRQYLKAYPPETQAQATQQWLSEHPAEAADIRSAVAYGYVAPLRSGDGTSGGQKVYSASECIGPVINGECRGSILPNQAVHPTCYGQMLNGICTGPQF